MKFYMPLTFSPVAGPQSHIFYADVAEAMCVSLSVLPLNPWSDQLFTEMVADSDYFLRSKLVSVP